MIAKKLHQIQTEIKALGKNTEAFNYKYVSGDKVLKEIRPRMDTLGLLLLPEVVDIINKPVEYDTVKTVKDYKTGTTRDITTHCVEILSTVKMRLTWVDIDDNERMTVEWMANGCNKFDKGFGSALTYGERYYLLKLFHLATDADDVDYISIERDKALEERPAPIETQHAPTYNRNSNPFQSAPLPGWDDMPM